MAAAVASRRNEAIVAALSKHLSALSLRPEKLSGKFLEEHSLVDLFTTVLQLSPNDEVLKWAKFAEDFSSDPASSHKALGVLEQALAPKAVLVGDGLKPSEADIVVFSALHLFVSGLSTTDRRGYPNVLRWMDYIQNKEEFGGAFEQISFEKAAFIPHEIKSPDNKTTLNQSAKILQASSQTSCQKVNDAVSDPKEGIMKKVPVHNKLSEEKKENLGKTPVDNKSSDEKRKKPVKETLEKEGEVNVSILNIQVGLICKAWKHPSADSLLVEEIDLGNGNVRQVVSGLAKHCSPDELVNRLVALITNVKPGKLRDVMSAGLVLCASNEDQSVVEPLIPPAGAIPGERILFSGYDGKPEDVLNPKKKQLEKITPDLYTDNKGIATYKGAPFMTSAGPCTSSIPKACIK